MADPETMAAAIAALAKAYDEDPLRDGAAIRAAWAILDPVLNAVPVGPQGTRSLDAAAVRMLAETLHRRLGADTRARRHELDAVLNAILAELKGWRFLTSPYRNHPVKIPRDTVLTLDAIDPGLVRAVATFREGLVGRELPTLPGPSAAGQPALWHFCVWLATLVLDTAALPERLLSPLVNLRNGHLRPAGWVRIETRRDRRDHRADIGEIVLPMQPVTWRAADRARRAATPSLQPGVPPPTLRVFPDAWLSAAWRRDFRGLWKEWLSTGGPVPHLGGGLTRLTQYGTLLALLRGVPPFLVPLATGRLPVRPVTLPSHYRVIMARPLDDLLPPDDAPGPARPRQRSGRHRVVLRGFRVFTAIETIRSKLRARAHRSTKRRTDNNRNKKWAITRIRAAIGATPFARTNEDAATANARMYGGFCIALLRRKNFAIPTALGRSSAIAAIFPLPEFQAKAFWDWEKQDYLSVLKQGMDDHETDYLVKALKDLVDCLKGEQVPTPKIPWADVERHAPRIVSPEPLIGFKDFERALTACDTLRAPEDLRSVLQVMLVLGFWCGLRASEATQLTLGHYVRKPYSMLEIRESKTFASTRDVPLSCLVPPVYLDVLEAWYTRRMRETGKNLEAPFLGRPRLIRRDEDNPLGFYDSGYLAGQAAHAVRCAVGESLSFQDARHACASWLLLRLLVANQQITVDATTHPWADPIAFGPDAIARLTPLLYGGRTFRPEESPPSARTALRAIVPREGRRECSHLAMVLARLIGHADPETTFSSYCRTIGLAHGLVVEQGWNGPFYSG